MTPNKSIMRGKNCNYICDISLKLCRSLDRFDRQKEVFLNVTTKANVGWKIYKERSDYKQGSEHIILTN